MILQAAVECMVQINIYPCTNIHNIYKKIIFYETKARM